MNEPSAQQVDAAVRAVLAQLGGRPALGGRASRLSCDQRSTRPFAGRLFACSHAEALPAGTNEVRVAPGTVVTPLALDHLRRQGIALRVEGNEGCGCGCSGKTKAGTWGYAIAEGSGVVQALARTLASSEKPWVDLGDDLDDVGAWVADDDGRAAVVVTAESSVAVWQANQTQGARAAAVNDADGVARAVRHLGANILVIEPAGKSLAWLKQMFLTYQRSGAPTPPAWLAEGPTHHAHRRSDRPGDAFARAAQPQERAVCACASHDLRSAHRGVAHAG